MNGTAFWTQLCDITLPDTIHLDGYPVPAGDHDGRSDIVDHISRVASSRRRHATPEGGFVAWGATTSVAKIPASMPGESDFYPSILVCIHHETLTSGPLEALQKATEAFAEESGLRVDPEQVKETLATMKDGYRGGCLPFRRSGV